MLLTNGDILRVAQDSETIWSIYDAALPAIVLSCFLMMGAAAIIAGLLTKSLVQPVLKMTDDLDHIQENVPYKELIPLLKASTPTGCCGKITRKCGRSSRPMSATS